MAESKVNRDNYITLQGWMITDLNLKGNELMIYAIIYGFSQTDNQVFNGSLQYLADWTNSTKESVRRCLKSLTLKGCIIKNDKVINGVKFCEYYTTKFAGVYNKVGGVYNKVGEGIQQSCTNNINIYSNDISNNKYRFKKPTLEEVKAYCLERNNNVDAERWYDHYETVGWKVGKNPMKDWKASVRTWERNNNGQVKSKPKPTFDYDQFTE